MAGDSPLMADQATDVPSLLSRLRQATQESHSRLESRFKWRSALSMTAYAEILAAFYGLYAPLETALHPVANAIPGLDWEARRKTARLTLDLGALGVDPAGTARLPLYAGFDPIRDVATAMGCLYVVEGATLGGQVISRHLTAQLGIGPDSGAAFFGGYGEATGTMWRRFTRCLQAEAHDRPEPAVTSAVATFAAFEAWLGRQGVLA